MYFYAGFCCCRHFVIGVFNHTCVSVDIHFSYFVLCFSLLPRINISDPSSVLQIQYFCIFLCANSIGSWHTFRLSFGDMTIVESVLLSTHSVSCYVYTYPIKANILKNHAKKSTQQVFVFLWMISNLIVLSFWRNSIHQFVCSENLCDRNSNKLAIWGFSGK